MKRYTKEELREAIVSVSSIISKSEKSSDEIGRGYWTVYTIKEDDKFNVYI